MIRSHKGTQAYWDEWVEYEKGAIHEFKNNLNRPGGDERYAPQFAFQIAQKHWHLMLRMYSHGDDVRDLPQYFPPMLDAWEESERLGKSVWTEQQQYTRHAWAVNLDHYIVCFWLVGLALALEIPDDQWKRLIALIGNEGEDALLDRVIASRQPGRKIGTKLCHPKPYQRLLDAVNAPKDEQPKLLLAFVKMWYAELDRPPKKGLSEKTAMYDRPYWHRYGDENFEDGTYFGRWCVEAVAAVKALGIDDSLCLGHPNYPGDLLRPDGPTTHAARSAEEQSSDGPASEEADTQRKRGWLARLLGA